MALSPAYRPDRRRRRGPVTSPRRGPRRETAAVNLPSAALRTVSHAEGAWPAGSRAGGAVRARATGARLGAAETGAGVSRGAQLSRPGLLGGVTVHSRLRGPSLHSPASLLPAFGWVLGESRCAPSGGTRVRAHATSAPT